MAFPNRFRRRYNLARDQANGAADSTVPAKVDVELNDLAQTLDLLNSFVRGITTSDGQLRQLTSALAESLAGAQRLVTTLGQTVLTTTIVWQTDFSNLSVQLNNNGTLIDSSLVSVADNGGFLEVTVSGGVAAGWTLVAAFQQGAGILTLLASTSVDEGAALVGVHDAGGLYNTSTVEDALQEVMQGLSDFMDDVGDLTTVLRSDATNWPPSTDLPMGSHKITGLAAASANGDAVRYEQLQAYVNSLTAFAALFLRIDGTVAMTADLNFGSHKGINLATAVNPTDAAPLGQVLPLAGGTMTGPIDMGAQNVKTTRAPVLGPDLTNKTYVDGAVQGASGLYLSVHKVTAPGTTTFAVPAGVTRMKIECWGAGAGGFSDNNVGLGAGGGGGYSISFPSVTPGDTLTIVCGAAGTAGAPGTSGGNSSVSAPGPTTLCSALGGSPAASKAAQGLGGTIGSAVGLFKMPGFPGTGNSGEETQAHGGNGAGPCGGQGSGDINAGSQPGGGGAAGSAYVGTGSDGGDGMVLISY